MDSVTTKETIGGNEFRSFAFHWADDGEKGAK
jgi:hypothetical protein